MRFRLYSSIAVRAEITKGDASAAARRLKVMAGIPELDVTAEVQPLADSIVHLLQLPPKAEMDATHVAFAVVHRMDYLLTWNCTHLANATLQKTITPFFPASGPVTGSFNGLHPKSNFLASSYARDQ